MNEVKRFVYTGSEEDIHEIGVDKDERSVSEYLMRILKSNIPAENENFDAFLDVIRKAAQKCFAYNKDSILMILAGAIILNDKSTFSQKAHKLVNEVCQDSEDILQFYQYSKFLAKKWNMPFGWGRCRRTAVKNWYQNKSAYEIAFSVARCFSYHRWSHKDLLRLCHLKPSSLELEILCSFIIKGSVETLNSLDENIKTSDDGEVCKLLEFLEVVKKISELQSVENIAQIIAGHSLTLEHFPCKYYNESELWKQVLFYLPMKQLLKNLPRLHKLHLLDGEDLWSRSVLERLMDRDLIKESKLHPITFFWYRHLYAAGQHRKKSYKWQPNQEILSALDDAFYISMQNACKVDCHLLVTVDLSQNDNYLLHKRYLKCSHVAAALCYILLSTQGSDKCDVRISKSFENVTLDENDTVESLKIKFTKKKSINGTDCAGSMIKAKKTDIKTDLFIHITDAKKLVEITNTKGGKKLTAPLAALKQYRQKPNLNSKARFLFLSLHEKLKMSEQEDEGVFNVAGFDEHVPLLLSSFAQGEF